MAIFQIVKSGKYRLNLYNRDRQESTVECQTLREAVDQAQKALANDVLPTSIEKYFDGDSQSGWFAAWYPDDTSGVYWERKMEIAASLEDFIKSNL